MRAHSRRSIHRGGNADAGGAFLSARECCADSNLIRAPGARLFCGAQQCGEWRVNLNGARAENRHGSPAENGGAQELFADDTFKQAVVAVMSRRASTSRGARCALLLLLLTLLCAFSAVALSVDASSDFAASVSGEGESCDLGSHTVALDAATRALTVTRVAHTGSTPSAPHLSAPASVKQLVLSASAPFVRAQSAPQRVRQWSGDFVVDNAAPALASDDQVIVRHDDAVYDKSTRNIVPAVVLIHTKKMLSCQICVGPTCDQEYVQSTRISCLFYLTHLTSVTDRGFVRVRRQCDHGCDDGHHHWSSGVWQPRAHGRVSPRLRRIGGRLWRL